MFDQCKNARRILDKTRTAVLFLDGFKDAVDKLDFKSQACQIMFRHLLNIYLLSFVFFP